jgi:hypothetical protein
VQPWHESGCKAARERLLCAACRRCHHVIQQSPHSTFTPESTHMKRAFESLTRRSALAACAAGGALATIARGLFSSPVPSEQLQAIPITPDPQRGYRLTEHVRRYYQSTRL